MVKDFRVVQRTPLLHSFVFDVERRTIASDDETFERDVATHRGAVSVLVFNENDEIGFIRQYRAPFDQYVLEIPAGTLDVDHEEPLQAAQRELREELGCVASEWKLLGTFMVSPGWTNQVMHIYEARGARVLGRRPEGPEETSSIVEWVPRNELKTRLQREGVLDYTLSVAMHRVFGTFFEQ